MWTHNNNNRKKKQLAVWYRPTHVYTYNNLNYNIVITWYSVRIYRALFRFDLFGQRLQCNSPYIVSFGHQQRKKWRHDDEVISIFFLVAKLIAIFINWLSLYYIIIPSWIVDYTPPPPPTCRGAVVVEVLWSKPECNFVVKDFREFYSYYFSFSVETTQKFLFPSSNI